MKKFTFIGAGSLTFTRNLVRDILSYDDFSDCKITLMDSDIDRLKIIESAVVHIINAGNYSAEVFSTTDRVQALRDADGVLCTIMVGGRKAISADIDIPMKYGVDINVGDTIGPSAIFRAMRTLPVMLDICKDISNYCPNAVFLNYTNPMSMLCKAMQSTCDVNVIGLCHSVQDCAKQMAGWMNIPPDELYYKCAGINHQSWYLELKYNGQDAYPLLLESIKNPINYNEELVRNDMLEHLGYMVTESSGHNSEYNAWYRKRPDLIEKYCTFSTGNNPGHHGVGARERDWEKEIRNFINDDDINLSIGNEYAASIFNAIFGNGDIFQFNGNILNKGYIENLPMNSCVEIPMLATPFGIQPLHVGSLPRQLAILNYTNANCHDLAVEGALSGDRQKILHAIYHDPLTASVLTLSEIKLMVDEMFIVNKHWLPQFD